MELRIKTTTYGDGCKKFELVKKHSIRIFGKTIAEWHTPFRETYFYRADVYHSDHGSYTMTEKILDERHFEYQQRVHAEAAKYVFETGPINYRGYKIIPIHDTSLRYRNYYTPSNDDYVYDGKYLMRGYVGSIDKCKDEIDSVIAAIEENRKKNTIVKSVIE